MRLIIDMDIHVDSPSNKERSQRYHCCGLKVTEKGVPVIPTAGCMRRTMAADETYDEAKARQKKALAALDAKCRRQLTQLKKQKKKKKTALEEEQALWDEKKAALIVEHAAQLEALYTPEQAERDAASAEAKAAAEAAQSAAETVAADAEAARIAARRERADKKKQRREERQPGIDAAKLAADVEAIETGSDAGITNERVLAERKGITALLEADGMQHWTMIRADGDCLFRAVANQVHQLQQLREPFDEAIVTATDATAEQDGTALMRSLAVGEMRRNKETYSVFWAGSEPGEASGLATFDDYIDSMAQARTWGGQLELCVLAIILQRPVIVYDAVNGKTVIQDALPGRPLSLTFHRTEVGGSGHYNSAVLRASPVSDRPMSTEVS